MREGISKYHALAASAAALRSFSATPVSIPIVIISWNCLFFVQNFIRQIQHLPNPIIILDNNSSNPELHKYYNVLDTNPGITVIRLRKNYGHEVYLTQRHLLPNVYILSDPDLHLNSKMPSNVSDILCGLSNEFRVFKVGLSLDISDSHLFEDLPSYMTIAKTNFNIHEWERQFWKFRIDHEKYELYMAGVDTTFTLVNWNFRTDHNKILNNIRIAGDFTAKHLPWYKDFLRNNLYTDDINHMKKGNISSTILMHTKL